MNIKIIGYNCNPEKGYLPESISAGFARVSRRKEPISFLIEEAKNDLEKARKSNETIVYDYGHSSIAEHVVFNVVFENISRLASSVIMTHRLNSYIEKSQRYITIESGFVVPEPKNKDSFISTAKFLFERYESLNKKLKEFLKKKYPGWKPIDIDIKAKEDARYVLPLCCFTQFGMTINARNFEYMITRLASNELEELKGIGKKLAEEGRKIAPSLIRYTNPNRFFSESYNNIKCLINIDIEEENLNGVRLVDWTEDADDRLLINLMHSSCYQSFGNIEEKIKDMKKEEKQKLIEASFKKISKHDPVLREFEYIDFTFEIEMSQACYHQFLRHRMNTQTTQEFSLNLGYIIPPLIKEAGLTEEFEKTIKISENFYKESHSEYILTNAHKVRVLVKMNAREIYHFSRIREEKYSQWEIRDIANKMLKLAKEKAPLALKLTGSRSEFEVKNG